MKDINFFSPYLQTKRKTTKRNMYFLSAISALVIMIVIYGFNYYRIKNIKENITVIDKKMQSKKIVKKLKVYQETKRRLDLLNNYYSKIKDINIVLDSANIVNTDLLKVIEGTFPDNLFLNSMTINQESVNMSIISANRIKAAELQHNLKETGLFSKVYINVINNTEKGVIFTANCTLKGDVDNEDVKEDE